MCRYWISFSKLRELLLKCATDFKDQRAKDHEKKLWEKTQKIIKSLYREKQAMIGKN